MSKPAPFLRSWAFYHVAFWAVIFVSLAIDSLEYARYDTLGYLQNLFLRNGLLIALTYVNLYYLLPRFYHAGRKILYWMLLTACVGVFVMIYNNFLFNVIPLFLRSETENKLWFQAASNFFLACRYLFISVLFSYIKEWFDQEKKVREMQIEKLKAESAYLRAQINPHFLFNTMNNLYGLSLRKSEKAPEIILRLSGMMDYMLHDNTDEKVLLSKDVEHLLNYIEIEKIRQRENAAITFTVTGNITGQRIIPLLFLPLVENAFKHGVNSGVACPRFDGKIIVSNGHVEFTMENNFKKLPPRNGIRSGIGIQNLQKRLHLFYEGKHTFSMKQTDSHYSVTLTVFIK
jgi:two-component system, LytTR family, sensor kinase